MAVKQRIRSERTGAAVASGARIADNPWTRMVGLLGKRGLDAGEALTIRPCSSVHTWFMRFSLDVIFLDRENRVLKVVRGLKPFRFSGARGSHSVIEMSAGSLAGIELERGDRLVFEDVDGR